MRASQEGRIVQLPQLRTWFERQLRELGVTRIGKRKTAFSNRFDRRGKTERLYPPALCQAAQPPQFRPGFELNSLDGVVISQIGEESVE
jgi:hypothetical protein